MKNNYHLYNCLLIYGILKIANCELTCKTTTNYEVCGDQEILKSVKLTNKTEHDVDFLYLHGVSEIESGAFETLSTLKQMTIDASSYNFRLQPNSFIGLEKLKTLDIHKTFIKLDKKIFQPLKSLEYLSLSIQGNSEELVDTLSHLKSLKNLEIFHSFLNKITEKTFDSLTRNIKRLSLINCNISSIEPTGFWSLNYLETLILNGNKLTILTNSDIFYGLKKLKYLFIASNKIKKIESNIFNELGNLIELDLSHNVIEKIDKSSFNGTAIEKLSLQDNKLSIIETGIFNSINKTLREIYLHNNYIFSIQNNCFIEMNLTVLDLSSNQLQTIPTGTFKNITIDNLYLESYFKNVIENNAFENSIIHNIYISNFFGNISSWGLANNNTRIFGIIRNQ